jgi:SAM-dependent methyltransferase
VNAYVQQNQPPGVPALELTGERTLPDVPAENYWFRRHLAVYEWIGARVVGQRVLDLACGEGYGSEVLSRGAAAVVGVDANPEAHEHARLRYQRQNLTFARGMVENFGEPGAYDAVVFLQTIEHVQDPAAVLRHLRGLLAPGGSAYISTPNVLTLAPRGEARSGNPWHVREYRADEFDALCRSAFGHVELLGLFHARKLWLHELALRAGWDRVHATLGITQAFYDRFTPAINSADFRLRPARRPGSGGLDGALDFLAVCRT